jgi:hypothetical protein
MLWLLRRRDRSTLRSNISDTLDAKTLDWDLATRGALCCKKVRTHIGSPQFEDVWVVALNLVLSTNRSSVLVVSQFSALPSLPRCLLDLVLLQIAKWRLGVF